MQFIDQFTCPDKHFETKLVRSIFGTCFTPVQSKQTNRSINLTVLVKTQKRNIIGRSNYTFSESFKREQWWHDFHRRVNKFKIWPLCWSLIDPTPFLSHLRLLHQDFPCFLNPLCKVSRYVRCLHHSERMGRGNHTTSLLTVMKGGMIHVFTIVWEKNKTHTTKTRIKKKKKKTNNKHVLERDQESDHKGEIIPHFCEIYYWYQFLLRSVV